MGPAKAKNKTTRRATTSAPHFPASNAHTGTRYWRESRSPSVWMTIVCRGPSSVERSSKEDLEQTREVLVRVERNVDLALPFRPQRDAHVGTQLAAQRLFDAPHLGGLPHSPLEARAPFRCAPPAHPVLDLAHREPLRHRLPRERRRPATILEGEEGACMTHRELAAMEHRQRALRQLQQPE